MGPEPQPRTRAPEVSRRTGCRGCLCFPASAAGTPGSPASPWRRPACGVRLPCREGPSQGGLSTQDKEGKQAETGGVLSDGSDATVGAAHQVPVMLFFPFCDPGVPEGRFSRWGAQGCC